MDGDTEKRRNGPFSSIKSRPKKRRLKKSKTRELGAFVLEQIEAQKHKPNPIRFTTPDGTRCRVWLASKQDPKGELWPNGKRYSYIIGDEVYWGCNVEELLDREKKRIEGKRKAVTAWNPTAKALRRPIIVVGQPRSGVARNEPIRDLKDALGELRGIRARVFINAQEELQVLGCGQRVVTVQFRVNKVLLHHNGNTAAMKRPAFKEFLALNKAARARHQAYLKSIRPSATIIPFRPRPMQAAA
jgi:hypothetical protein